MTERKIEMRRHGPPRNSVSAVSSITSTLPWAGATMTLASEGTFGFGSRKNQRQKRENNSQSPNKKPAMPFRKAPTSIDAMPMTTTPSSATSVQKINFSAAWVALPLCFMPAILIGGGGEGKEDICQEGARGRRTEFFETKPQRTQRTQRGEAATKGARTSVRRKVDQRTGLGNCPARVVGAHVPAE